MIAKLKATLFHGGSLAGPQGTDKGWPAEWVWLIIEQKTTDEEMNELSSRLPSALCEMVPSRM